MLALDVHFIAVSQCFPVLAALKNRFQEAFFTQESAHGTIKEDLVQASSVGLGWRGVKFYEQWNTASVSPPHSPNSLSCLLLLSKEKIEIWKIEKGKNWPPGPVK